MILALVLLLLMPGLAGAAQHVLSIEAISDCYLDEELPTTNNGNAIDLQWDANDGFDKVPLMRFNLTTIDVVIDSATVVVNHTDSALSSSLWRTYRVLRNPNYLQATWNVYSTGNNWGTAGAWGAADIDLSTDYGYGATGVLYRGNNPTVNPDTTVICRGAGFTALIESLIGSAIHLALHDDGTDAAGAMALASREHPDTPGPTLRIYWHDVSTGGRRRIILQAP